MYRAVGLVNEVTTHIGQQPAAADPVGPRSAAIAGHSADDGLSSADDGLSSADDCGAESRLFPQVSPPMAPTSADSADDGGTYLLAIWGVTSAHPLKVRVGTPMCRAAADVGTTDPVGTGGSS
jgi:hypothetical protein